MNLKSPELRSSDLFIFCIAFEQYTVHHRRNTFLYSYNFQGKVPVSMTKETFKSTCESFWIKNNK